MLAENRSEAPLAVIPLSVSARLLTLVNYAPFLYIWRHNYMAEVAVPAHDSRAALPATTQTLAVCMSNMGS